MQVAQTILEQLGGRKFIVMTGAKNFVGDEKMLMFSLPKNASGANKVRITLTPTDLYDIEFFKIRGTTVTLLDAIEEVYAESLQDIFTERTGFLTRL